MPLERAPLGAKLAAAGSALVLLSLWLPWYQITFPAAFRDALGKLGGAAAPTTGAPPAQGFGGALSALVAGLATSIPDKISADGWQAMKAADIVLAVLVGLVVLLLTNGLGLVKIESASRGQALAGIGLLAVVIVGYHVIRRPFGDAPGFIEAPKLQYGIALALIGGVLIGAGGHQLSTDEQPATVVDLPPFSSAAVLVAEPEPFSATYAAPAPGASVAPPGLS